MAIKSSTHSDTEDSGEFIAVLKRGKSFTLGINPDTSRRFVAGQDYIIDAALRDRLAEKAVDEIDTGDFDDDGYIITEPKCKFDFRRVGEPEKKVAPRRRQRAG